MTNEERYKLKLRLLVVENHDRARVLFKKKELECKYIMILL
uniref:Uncharacterized protein n=1 Tax=Dulem virus 35 TaxID=3145753 RepID=A0AAU8AZB4_9CAUD